jgi:hypothetical protein
MVMNVEVKVIPPPPPPKPKREFVMTFSEEEMGALLEFANWGQHIPGAIPFYQYSSKKGVTVMLNTVWKVAEEFKETLLNREKSSG